MLARLTSEQQSLVELIESAAGLALLGIAPLFLLLAVRSQSLLGKMIQIFAGTAPLALVAAGIITPQALKLGSLAAAALGAAVIAAISIRRVTAVQRGGNPFPAPLEILTVLAAAAAAAWATGPGWPPWTIVLPLALTWLLLAIVPARPSVVGVAAVLAGVAACSPTLTKAPAWEANQSSATGPDIILISVDTLRADVARDMRSFQRISRDGTTYLDAVAASPWTVPSTATLFTGLSVSEHGAGRRPSGQWIGLADKHATLAEKLSAAGYDTAAIIHSGVLGRDYRFDRGFHVFQNSRDDATWGLPRGRQSREALPVVPRLLTLARLSGRGPYYDDSQIIRRAAKILANRRDHPLFLWLHFFDSHAPLRRTDDTDVAWHARMVLERGDTDVIREDPDFWSSDQGRDALWITYRNEVQHIDAAIESFLDLLEEQPQRDRVIVFLSDHGEEFFEHGGYEHGHSFYEEVVQIPLAISGLPGGPPPGTVERRTVGHIDIAPTLLAAAGLQNDDLRGQDLARGPGSEPYVVEQLLYGANGNQQFAIREGKWKLIFRSENEAMLFDLDADPDERSDLSQNHPELVDRLASLRVLLNPPTDQPIEQQDPAAIDALRALGYID